ncbi:hypothetical protein PVIIG_03147 [Plasmodium vivax India VII]|uniref:Uncharacterized protein n=1 Tax=Plasmodium vivax India VII TaxID=1077284 RepID=A0A0J9SCV4_PLAVI|nr:hypothetical protein PVIIG_03147 [Plasmodium vivax India VII]
MYIYLLIFFSTFILYLQIKACSAHFYEAFNEVLSIFDKDYVDKYLDSIKNISDPILRHVALYLVQNYEYAKKYFSEDGKRNHNPACESLNIWLDQKKSFFTHAEKCQSNVKLWKKYIDPLWDKLHSNNDGNTCERLEYFTNTLSIPSELLPATCYMHVPKNYKCTPPSPEKKFRLITMCPKISEQCSKCKEKGLLQLSTPNEQVAALARCPLIVPPTTLSSPKYQVSCEVNCPSEIHMIAFSINACPMYYYEIFNQYPSVVKPEVNEYLDIIKNYSDPILRYIALYLIYNYKNAQKLFTGAKNYQDDLACNNLNRWLDQSKSFFTHSQKSSSNASLWKIYIEDLWKTLDSKNKGNKCPRKEYFSNTTQIPEELGLVMEYGKYPDDYICYDPLEEDHTVIRGDCYKLNELCSECENLRVLQEKSSNSKAPHQEICLTLYKSLQISQLEVPESCGACPSLIRMLSFPVFVTFSGTLFIAFFLYKVI